MTPTTNNPRTVLINRTQSAWTDIDERNIALNTYFGPTAAPASIRYLAVETTEIDANQEKILEITVSKFDKPKEVELSYQFINDIAIQLPRNHLDLGRLPVQLPNNFRRFVLRTDIGEIIAAHGSDTLFIFRFSVRSLFWNRRRGFFIAPGQDPLNDDLFLTMFPYDYITDDDIPLIFPSISVGPHPTGLTASCGVKIPGGRS